MKILRIFGWAVMGLYLAPFVVLPVGFGLQALGLNHWLAFGVPTLAVIVPWTIYMRGE